MNSSIESMPGSVSSASSKSFPRVFAQCLAIVLERHRSHFHGPQPAQERLVAIEQFSGFRRCGHDQADRPFLVLHHVPENFQERIHAVLGLVTTTVLDLVEVNCGNPTFPEIVHHQVGQVIFVPTTTCKMPQLAQNGVEGFTRPTMPAQRSTRWPTFAS